MQAGGLQHSTANLRITRLWWHTRLVDHCRNKWRIPGTCIDNNKRYDKGVEVHTLWAVLHSVYFALKHLFMNDLIKQFLFLELSNNWKYFVHLIVDFDKRRYFSIATFQQFVYRKMLTFRPPSQRPWSALHCPNGCTTACRRMETGKVWLWIVWKQPTR